MISAATKAKLGEAHEHLKAAKAVLEALHGGLADGNEEEDAATTPKASTKALVNQGRKPVQPLAPRTPRFKRTFGHARSWAALKLWRAKRSDDLMPTSAPTAKSNSS
jgi:hypothetical protein